MAQRPCPQCNGTGVGSDDHDEWLCHRCNGSGEDPDVRDAGEPPVIREPDA